MKWIQQNAAITGDTVDLTVAGVTAAGAAGLTPASTLSCTTVAATALLAVPGDISLATDVYGNVTGFSILISLGSLNGNDTFQIAFDTTAAIDIGLAPITSGSPPLINSKTLKISASCNGGAQTAEVGNIRVLKVPILVSALATTNLQDGVSLIV